VNPFYRQLLALSLVFIVAAAALTRWAPTFVHPWFGWLLAFVAGITAGAFAFTVRLVERDPDSAVNAYLGSVTLRLLTSGLFIGIVLFQDPPQIWLLVMTFFLLYFSYTGLEIRAVVRTLRPFSNGRLPDANSAKS
jgi:drug/metabolite transporter (DMT)-like permease